MAATVTPFLMFQGDCEEAIRAYVSLFKDGKLDSLVLWAEDSPGDAGKVMAARFRLAGQVFRANDSPAVHDFTFTPSLSIFVDFDSEAELERTYAALLDGGSELMPIGDYGFSHRFGWLNDRWGVSWQLNLPG